MPTIIDGLGPQATACQTEAFGPVLLALPFTDEAELIEQANGTAFGLACGIWTENFRKGWRIGRALEAGSVWINTYKQSVTPRLSVVLRKAVSGVKKAWTVCGSMHKSRACISACKRFPSRFPNKWRPYEGGILQIHHMEIMK